MEYSFSEEEASIIEENAAYVLGMYDLYRNDNEIWEALKAKQISPGLVPFILHRIKLPAYQKRIRQSKKQIIYSGLLIILFLLVILFFRQLPGAENLLKSKDSMDDILIFIVKFYREIFYIHFFFVILVFIAGILSLKKYTRLLSKAHHTGNSTLPG